MSKGQRNSPVSHGMGKYCVGAGGQECRWGSLWVRPVSPLLHPLTYRGFIHLWLFFPIKCQLLELLWEQSEGVVVLRWLTVQFALLIPLWGVPHLLSEWNMRQPICSSSSFTYEAHAVVATLPVYRSDICSASTLLYLVIETGKTCKEKITGLFLYFC